MNLCTEKGQLLPFITLSDLPDMSFLAIYTFLLNTLHETIALVAVVISFSSGFGQNWFVFSSH